MAETKTDVSCNGRDMTHCQLMPVTQTPPSFRPTSTGSMEMIGIHEHKTLKVLEFEHLFRQPAEHLCIKEKIHKTLFKNCSKFSLKNIMLQNFPFLKILRGYKITQDLPNDIIAGLTSGVMMIPQGMAFASLSTLPPIVGLYISMFASLTYFFLGTSQQLSWGCVAILSIMTGSILDKYDTKISSSNTINCDNSSPFQITSFSTFLETTTGMSYSANSSSMLTNNSSLVLTAGDLDAFRMNKRIEVAGSVTLTCGIILVILGKLGFGKITCFMSDSLINGFTVGVSFHVVSSQLKTTLGLEFPRESGMFKLVKFWVSILANIHHSNFVTILVSLACIVIIYVVKRFINEKYKEKLRIPVPVELFVVIIATIITANANLSEKYSVSIVKDIPVGVPKPIIPDMTLSTDYIADGMIIIIISFVQSVAMAKTMGLKHNVNVDSNQEMFACGMTSVVCSIFSGYFPAASVSRSIVQDGAGGKTQVASLFAAGLVLLVVILIGPYFYYLPKCVLAVIIIINLRSMFLQLLKIEELWQKSHMDALMWGITCVAVIIFDADIGLFVGIIVSILCVMIHSQIASVDVLKQISVGEANIWRSVDRYFGGQEIHGIKVIKINNSLYFANADIVTNLVFEKTGVNPMAIHHHLPVLIKVPLEDIDILKASDKKVHSDQTLPLVSEKNISSDDISIEMFKCTNIEGSLSNHIEQFTFPNSKFPISALIVDLSGVSFIDLAGVKALELLVTEFKLIGISVFISHVHENCIDILEKSGFMDQHCERIFLTTEAAVASWRGFKIT